MNPGAEAAAEAVAAAWTEAGTHPGYHVAWQETLRSEWPTLANALDRLASVITEEGRA